MQSYEFPPQHFAGKLDEFRPKNFLTAGMFDVLEHIPNDTSALVECAGLLKKMACCTSVPRTGQSCGHVYDDISGHKRRYTKGSLKIVLERSGFA